MELVSISYFPRASFERFLKREHDNKRCQENEKKKILVEKINIPKIYGNTIDSIFAKKKLDKRLVRYSQSRI